MIRINNKKIEQVYCGLRRIQQVYKGDKLVYNLPKEEVDTSVDRIINVWPVYLDDLNEYNYWFEVKLNDKKTEDKLAASIFNNYEKYNFQIILDNTNVMPMEPYFFHSLQKPNEGRWLVGPRNSGRPLFSDPKDLGKHHIRYQVIEKAAKEIIVDVETDIYFMAPIASNRQDATPKGGIYEISKFDNKECLFKIFYNTKDIDKLQLSRNDMDELDLGIITYYSNDFSIIPNSVSTTGYCYNCKFSEDFLNGGYYRICTIFDEYIYYTCNFKVSLERGELEFLKDRQIILDGEPEIGPVYCNTYNPEKPFMRLKFKSIDQLDEYYYYPNEHFEIIYGDSGYGSGNIMDCEFRVDYSFSNVSEGGYNVYYLDVFDSNCTMNRYHSMYEIGCNLSIYYDGSPIFSSLWNGPYENIWSYQFLAEPLIGVDDNYPHAGVSRHSYISDGQNIECFFCKNLGYENLENIKIYITDQYNIYSSPDTYMSFEPSSDGYYNQFTGGMETFNQILFNLDDIVNSMFDYVGDSVYYNSYRVRFGCTVNGQQCFTKMVWRIDFNDRSITYDQHIDWY